MQHGPLSARGELQSHPLAGQAQACGRPTQVEGPGGRWHLSWPLAGTTAQKNSTTFLDSCMSSLHLFMLFFSVSFQARNSSNYVRHPYAGALLSSARADVGISDANAVGEGVETGKSSGQCTVVNPVQSTAREFHTSPPSRRTSPLFNNFLNPAIHSCKKKTRYVLSLYMPKRRPKSRSYCACHRKPLCTRAVLNSVSFKSDEHQ